MLFRLLDVFGLDCELWTKRFITHLELVLLALESADTLLEPLLALLRLLDFLLELLLELAGRYLEFV